MSKKDLKKMEKAKNTKLGIDKTQKKDPMQQTVCKGIHSSLRTIRHNLTHHHHHQ
jgi:hypothetical protein